MDCRKIDRRAFVRDGSALVACAVAGSSLGAERPQESPDPRQIVNYHQQMHYRRLGKTCLMLSELSLGGHWRGRDGGGFWPSFPGDTVPDDVATNRTEVVSDCIDRGMNYLDITTASECQAYGLALKGRREKMIVGADDYRLCPRNPTNRSVKAQIQNVEECLRRLEIEYLDIWRVQALQAGGHSDAEVSAWIEAFQKLRQAGKAKHFGISTHCRPWIQRVVATFPEVEMVIFPCTAKTRQAQLPPTKDNVVEGTMPPAWHSDTSESIFDAVQRKDVGLVTIKPFIGGALFPTPKKFPVLGEGSREENDLARLTLQCVLANKAITAVVPGLTTVHEVACAASASHLRPLGMTLEEKRWLARRTDDCWQHLPDHYAWLRDWEQV